MEQSPLHDLPCRAMQFVVAQGMQSSGAQYRQRTSFLSPIRTDRWELNLGVNG